MSTFYTDIAEAGREFRDPLEIRQEAERLRAEFFADCARRAGDWLRGLARSGTQRKPV